MILGRPFEMKQYIASGFAVLMLLGVLTQGWAQEYGMELFTTKDKVETRIGTLDFDMGMPTQETIKNLYDEMDFQRAVQAYLWAIPLVGFAQWQEEHEQVFGAEDGDVVYYVSYRDKLGLLTRSAAASGVTLHSIKSSGLEGGATAEGTAIEAGGAASACLREGVRAGPLAFFFFSTIFSRTRVALPVRSRR